MNQKDGKDERFQQHITEILKFRRKCILWNLEYRNYLLLKTAKWQK